MSLPRYPKYKDSGAEWLGEVPSDWDVRRIRFLFQIKKRIAGAEGYDVLSITQQGIKIKDVESNDGQLSQDYSKYQFVEIGDFAMNHMDLLTGYVDISKFSGVTSPDYRVFSLKNSNTCDSRYFLYIFQIGYKQKIFYPFGQGSSQLGRWRLPTEQFQDFVLPLPSQNEQSHIAAFIDTETQKIDALVQEQKGLIELLREKRQAVISHAVTKGLNSDVPMKDSGIEWLGKVPAHWQVKQLAHLARLGTVITYGIVQAGPDIEGGIPYIRTSDMSGDYLPEDGYLRTTNEIDASYARSKIQKGDIVIAIRATIGKSLMVPDYLDGANLTQGTAKFSPGPACEGRFVMYFLNSVAKFWFDRVSKGATFKEITLEMLRKTRVSLPPIHEQRSIVDYLDGVAGGLDELTAEAARAIDLLGERRTALVSAAVTGKIDVRGLATEGAA